MPESETQRTRHSVTVKAPAEALFDLVADVERWPFIFPPTVHAERVEQNGSEERIRLWALANGEVKSWTSHRSLDRERLTVRFRQEVSQPPVAAMGGEWVFEPRSDQETVVVLHHDYRTLDDAPEKLSWVRQAVDRNSAAELGRLRDVMEQNDEVGTLTLEFEDSVRVQAPPSAVFRFLEAADRWPERLPHVSRMELREDAPGIQQMEMDTLAADGTTHTTKSVRVCFDGRRIVYKQTQLPKAMAGHTGEWLLREQADGSVLVTSRHVVLIDRRGVAQVLGEKVTVDEAKAIIRTALSRNSTTTLEHARRFAEERSDG
ncbi:aromatase/cyclase [Streptomyces bacillaris]|uniref:aromatase/cyclase n=1 Tax=Streptomyces bacillaris TaxID=68179 RepID=UPI00335AA741